MLNTSLLQLSAQIPFCLSNSLVVCFMRKLTTTMLYFVACFAGVLQSID